MGWRISEQDDGKYCILATVDDVVVERDLTEAEVIDRFVENFQASFPIDFAKKLIAFLSSKLEAANKHNAELLADIADLKSALQRLKSIMGPPLCADDIANVNKQLEESEKVQQTLNALFKAHHTDLEIRMRNAFFVRTARDNALGIVSIRSVDALLYFTPELIEHMEPTKEWWRRERHIEALKEKTDEESK